MISINLKCIVNHFSRRIYYKILLIYYTKPDLKGGNMAIFNKNDKFDDDDLSEKESTTISQGTEITGNITLQCDIIIDGEITGDISSNSVVTIDKHGKVKGSIVAQSILNYGIFEGDLDADYVELLDNSVTVGNVISDRFKTAETAIFEGNKKRKKKSDENLLRLDSDISTRFTDLDDPDLPD